MAIRIPPFGAVFMKGQGKLRAKPKPKTAKQTAETAETVETVEAAATPAVKKAAVKTVTNAEVTKKPATRGRKKASAPEE